MSIGIAMQNRIPGLRSAVIAVFLATLPVAIPANPVSAGPLTNIFLDSLENHGRASWAEGYQKGSVETLHDVILRMNDGRRYDIGTLALGHENNVLLVDATDIRMNPEDDILLLKADRMIFKGHAGILETFWTLEMITDACALSGPENSLRVENPGLILSGAGNVLSKTGDLLIRDSKTRMKSLDLAFAMAGDHELCTVDVDLSVKKYQSTHLDGSLSRVNNIEFSMQLPGSIASLSANPLQAVTVDLKTGNVRKFIPGGGTAWSLGESTVSMQFEALGLVPGLTLILKQFDKETPGFKSNDRMRLWNTLGELRGSVSIVMEHMTMRLANIVPTDYVTRFIDANLTTLLFDLTGDLDIADGKVMLVAESEITGLADIDLETEFRPGTYSEEIIAHTETSLLPFNRIMPVYLDSFRYAQTDLGLISAAEDIMEIPVTIQINRIRENRSAEYPEISDVIRNITTAVANFLNLSLKTPPAVLELSIGNGLDLREALIIASELPKNIPDIFEFSVFSDAGNEE